MTATSLPDTRTRILDAALDLFSEHGFEGTTLQQIADRLGFTKAALYYHFRSKDDLLHALHEPAAADLDRLLDAHAQLPNTAARRQQFVADYLDFLLRHRRLIAYTFRDLATLAHPAVASGSRERRARIEAALAGDDVDFSGQVRIAMVFGGMHSVIARYPDCDDPALRDALIDAAGMLLRPRRSVHARPRSQGEGERVGPHTLERRRDAPA
ncbi:MAG TPA: helix-turn-helix domain-containing protein [Solirubrobacteraceae bacterium]|jgi:AcrR family transcriptional regulator